MSDRFWSKVDKSDECWLWTGCVTRNGYGRYPLNGSSVLAHRHAYEMAVGPIPRGLTIDHLCRTKRCVRVEHMELVTLAENIRRRPIAGVAAENARKTHCPRGHALTPGNLRGGQRPGNRSCKKCCAINAMRRKHAA